MVGGPLSKLEISPTLYIRFDNAIHNTEGNSSRWPCMDCSGEKRVSHFGYWP